MSSVALSRFQTAKYRPSSRVTKCKNCMDWPGFKPESPIQAGQPRIVISGGWGPSTRNLTLCPNCAEREADILDSLVVQIRKALRKKNVKLSR